MLQAMRRKARNLGLTHLLETNETAKRVVKMTMALGLLPANDIGNCFDQICGFAARHNIGLELEGYLNYVQRTWIEGNKL